MSQFRCPVCGFVQGYLTLHAPSGNIGDNAGPDELQMDSANGVGNAVFAAAGSCAEMLAQRLRLRA